MAAIIDRTGQHYGHWIALEQDKIKSKETGRTYWICECDCGCGLRKSISTSNLPNIKVGGCSKYKTKLYSQSTNICLKCEKSFYPKLYGQTRKYCFDCIPEDFYINANGAQVRRKMKEWALEEKGGFCQICGYNKCSEALEFHHLNPNKKDFNLSDRNLKNNWPDIKKEIDKCILVCSNCHREIHSGYIKLDLKGRVV